MSSKAADPQTAWTPSKAAYKLTHILNTISEAHGLPRFPVDVVELARGAAEIFHWPDPITQVVAAPIEKFEGALFPDDTRSRWMLLYNDALKSQGRIRFTQAHELGHYVLHRAMRARFECSDGDMIDLVGDEVDIESQADSFASTLLMPLDDFRARMGGRESLEALGDCADHYGVSLTAAVLRWVKHTDRSAVLVVHCDDFILWTCSSRAAMRAGAFFRTRGHPPRAVPAGTLAANPNTTRELEGVPIQARLWFPHAPRGEYLSEMKVQADNYHFTMSLLVLPSRMKVWPPDKWQR
jgi:hypothetical protein